MEAPDPPLTDDAIALRQFTLPDVPAIVRGCSDPLVHRYIPLVPVPYTEADAEQFVERSDGLPDELNLAITDRHSGEVLGAVGFRHKHYDPAIAEIGYWLTPDARGRGAATRALRLLSRWILRERHVARLQLHTDVENTASQAVATRAGFIREGVLRASTDNRGTRRDAVSFSLLPEDL
jgi:RimJ/RimL family protein N-acetyltransferase